MKRLKLLPLFIVVGLLFTTVSCDDDTTFTQMKAIENLLYMNIRDYRVEQSQSSVTINLDTMVPEAQAYAYKMATGTVEVSTDALSTHWFTIHDHWGGTNDVSIVMRYDYDGMTGISADMIFEAMKADSAMNAGLLADVSICGVGVESDSTGNAYVTYLAMLVE